MDWLTFKFCVLIWMLCVSKSQSQLRNSTSISTNNQLRPACLEDRPVLPPNPCNTCICFSGQVYCTKHPCPEKECINGVELPQPDECNKCICQQGKVACTNMICIPAPLCTETQQYPAQNKCNDCMCKDGFISCTTNVCEEEPMTTTTTTTKPKKKKKCEDGSRLPGPDQCLDCICQNGRKRCKNVCNPSVVESQLQATTTKPKKKKKKKKKKCEDGSRLPGPDQCLDCICQNGRKRCKNVCNPSVVESRLQATTTKPKKKKKKCEEGSGLPTPSQCLECICQNGPECFPGQLITRPDDCNKCICFEGQIHCTHLPCRVESRIGLECTDDQPVYRLDECNECYCIEGRLECSDLVCIRGSKCVEGQVIPKPDSCNNCKCVEGHILCTNHECSMNLSDALLLEPSTTEVIPLEECQEGDYIPPPPPPNDCNTCHCIDNHIVCTMINCEGTIPEFKGRLKEKNEKTNLEKFDKKIPVEPFINILYKNNDKIPQKIIHSHTYNGFHQEIKVHASHLPKDPTKLLNVLANSLDNAGLASISQKLLTSNSASSNQDSKKPIDHSVNQTNQLGEENVLSAQSSKLIISGSQSNETMLVFPHKKPFDDQDSQSLLPLDSKRETTLKIVSAPDTLVYNNGIQIIPHLSQEENGNHYYENISSRITPIDPNSTMITRNPAKFDHPGQHYGLPSKHAWESADTPSISTQTIYPTLHPNPININDGKMIYAQFSQKNKQIKPDPSSFVANRDELPHLRPFQATKPGPNHIYNHTSPTPVFRPEQYELNPDNIVGQQKPSQYHFTPNPSNLNPNQGTPQQFQSKLIRIPNTNYSYNNKVVPLPAKFLNKPNQPIASANQYKQPQFGLKPAPGSSYPNNIHLNPAPTNLPYLKNRISTIDNEAPQFHHNHSDILNLSLNEVKDKQPNSPQAQLILNPSIYYKNEYEAPKIIEENPDKDQLTPNSIISYKHTEDYDPLNTPSESGYEKQPHKVHTHSLYEKHTSVAYVSEYDPNDPDDSTPVDHDLNEQHNGPLKYAFLSDEDSQEFDLNEKVNHYLNIPYLQLYQKEHHPKSIQSYLTSPGQRQNDTLYLTMPEINKYDQHDSWNIINRQFEENQLSPSQNKETDIKTNQNETHSVLPINIAIYLHKPFKPELVSLQENSEKEDSEDPTHLKSNDHQPPPSQTGHPQNQVFDDQGSNNGFQYTDNAYDDPRQFKPLHKVLPPKLETPPNHQLPGMFDERGSTDGIQNPFQLNAKDLTYSKIKLNKSPHFDSYKSMLNAQQPKDNQHIALYSQFGPTQNQHKPEDNHGVENRFQYAHNANEDYRELKPFYKLPPFPAVPTPNKQTPGMFDDRGSLDGFRHPSYLAEITIHSRENLHNFPPNQFGPDKKHLPGVFDAHGYADGFYYPSKSADISVLPNDLFIKYGPTENQHEPWRFDESGSTGSLQNPPSSTEYSLFPIGNIQNLPQSKPDRNQRLPGVFDGRGSTVGLHNPTKSAKLPFQPKYKPQNSSFTPTQKQKSPGISDDQGSTDGFRYPTNSNQKPNYNLYKSPNSPFRPVQSQYLPEDDRGSANSLHYPSNSEKTPFNPKNNIYKPSNSLFRPTQKHNQPGVFADGIQYPSDSSEENIQESPNFPFGPILNKPTQGKFGDRGSMGGSKYPFNSAGDPKHPKVKIPLSPLGPTKHLPGIFDERGSADGFQYPSHSGKNPLQPKSNQQNPSLPQLGPNQSQHMPGVFDDRGPADDFQYPSHTAENPLQPKGNQQNPSYPQLGINQNQHMPGVFDDHGSADGFKYPSHAAENPLQPKGNQQNPSYPQLGINQNQHMPGVFDDRGPADEFQYPSHAAENPLQPKGNQQNPSYPQMGPNQNQHMPGVFDDRGPADGFQYPSHAAENPLQPKGNQHNPSYPQLGPNQNQHMPGVFDDRGPADEFQYPSHAAENPLQPKGNQQNPSYPQLGINQNQHMPGVFDDRGPADGFQYPSHAAENPLQPNGNQHNPSYPQLGPNQNQHMPGVFDDRGPADEFQYPSHAAENPLQPKGNQQNPSYPQMGPNQNQHMPGVFDDRGSADGFQYPSHAAENPLQPKGNQQNPSYPQLGPNQNQHMPGVFDDRGLADGFQYPSHAAENPLQPKDNRQNPLHPQLGPNQNQHMPGVFDDRGSADGFQYPSHAAENPLQPKGNQQNPSHPQMGPKHNQHMPGVFDGRGSADGFQYPSHAVENPLQPKDNRQNPSHPQLGPNQNQHMPGVFDDRGPADGFQYPSHAAENPLQPKGNQHNPSYPQLGPNQNQLMPGVFDDRGPADGFQYLSHAAENPLQPKGNQHNPSYPQLGPNQNQHMPGVFDDRGSADGFQYPSHAAENPLQLKDNRQNPSHPQLGPNQNQHMPGVFDDSGSADEFQYPSHAADNPLQPKGNQQYPSLPQLGPNQNQHMPGVFDGRGSADGFQYPSHAAENPLQPKGNQQNPSYPQMGPNQNQHMPGVFDDRGSADGFQYPSHTADNPLQPKGNQQNPSHPQMGPNHNQHMPGVFDDRGPADGFQYPSHAADNPLQPKGNQQYPSLPQLGPNQNQNMPGVFDDRGSADECQYPSHASENLLQPKGNQQNPSHPLLGPNQNHHMPGVLDDLGSADGFQYPSDAAENPLQPKDNRQNRSHPQFGPNQNQHMPGVFDDRGPADEFQYPSHAAENPLQPKGNQQNPSHPQMGPNHNQHMPGVFDGHGSADGFQYPSHGTENPVQSKGNQQNPSHPQLGPNQNQHMPGVFDDRGSADGFHYPSDSAEDPKHPNDNPDTTPESNSSTRPPRFKPYYDQSIQSSSFDNLFNGIHHIPRPVPDQDNNALGSNAELTTPHSEFKPQQDQYENIDLFDEDDDHLQKEIDNSTDLINSDSMQNNPNHRIKPDNVLDRFLPTDGGHLTDQLNALFIALKKLSKPSNDDLGLSSMDKLALLPILFPKIADILNYNQSKEQDDEAPVENQVLKRIFPLKKLKSKLNQLTDRILNWFKSKFFPTKDNTTETKNEIDFAAENPLQLKDNRQNPSQPPLGPNQNQHMPGVIKDRGSADVFQSPSHAAENPLQPKGNQQYPSLPQLGPNQNQHMPGVFDDRGSADECQYPSHASENPLQPKGNQQYPSLPQLGPNQNHHMPGVFDDRGSTDGFQYPSHYAENPLQPKGYQQNPLLPQLGSNQNHHMPGVFDDRGSTDGFQYPSHYAENPLQPKGYQQNPSLSQLGPNQNQHMPGVFDDRGSADGIQYPSHYAENPLQPKGNQQNPFLPQLGPNQNQHMPELFDDRGSADGFQYPFHAAENLLQPKGNQQNPSDPQLGPNQNQHMPGVFDDRGSADGFNYPSDSAEDPKHPNDNPDTTPESNSSTRPPRFKPDDDQYKPSSFDNFFNGIHHIPRLVPDQDNNALGSNAELSTPHSEFKPQQDQYENIDLFDEDDDHLQKEIYNSTDLINSDSMQNNPNHRIKPDNVLDKFLPTDGGHFPDHYDQLYALFIALKKLSKSSNDDLGLSSMDKLALLPILFPKIADILNYNQSKEQDDEAPVENQVLKRIFPLIKLKSKLNQLTDRILNWLKSKLKLFPTKDNTTETKNEIVFAKIFGLLSKLNENDNGNRFQSIPTALKETQQQDKKKYPEVHIILNQPDDEDNLDLPPYTEADGEAGLATDIGSKWVHSRLFPNMLYPRFKHRPKDQKEECGDGTQWISNCHSCFCYFGQTMCLRMKDCKLRPFGEPMICKPYSHFKMGCYTCECNGDGVTECDAIDCSEEPKGERQVSGPRELALPIYHESFDDKTTNEILQYYKSYKKLPKDCPRQNSQIEYPTCERGTSWISSCHKCECNERGKHECAKINDCVLNFDSYGKPGRCKPNSKFFPKTNSMPCVECLCNDEGILSCPKADVKKH